jgi:hypothetical protein
MKFQIANNKFQTNPNNQNSNFKHFPMASFAQLVIGFACFRVFAHWKLDFGICL